MVFTHFLAGYREDSSTDCSRTITDLASQCETLEVLAARSYYQGFKVANVCDKELVLFTEQGTSYFKMKVTAAIKGLQCWHFSLSLGFQFQLKALLLTFLTVYSYLWNIKANKLTHSRTLGVFRSTGIAAQKIVFFCLLTALNSRYSLVERDFESSW